MKGFLRRLALDPLMVKELSGVSRRWQTYVGRTVYIGLIGTMLLLIWSFTVRYAGQSYSEMAMLGRVLFAWFSGMQMLFVSVAAVSAACDLVTKEVRAGTLGLLALTPLTPWRIAFGKWKAALAQVFTLILGGMPVLAVCVYLGGVGAYDVLWSFSLSLAAAALSASVALRCSARYRTSHVAMMVALGVLFGWALLPVVLGLFFQSGHVLAVFCFVHPAYAAVATSAGRIPGVMDFGEYAWISATAVSLALALLFVRAAAARIAALIVAPGGPSATAQASHGADAAYARFAPRRRVSRFAGEQVWDRNPLLWKELQSRASGRLRNATRVSLGILLLGILPLSLIFGRGEAWHIPMLYLSVFLFIAMALLNGVSLFAQEKEGRQWDVLLSTPLTAGEIVAAKLVGGLGALAPLGAILFTLFTLISFGVGAPGVAWFMVVGSVALFVGFCYAIAAAASLRARTLRAAFSFSSGLVAGILWILPIFVGIILSFTPGSRDDGFLSKVLDVTNPFHFLFPVIERAWNYGDLRTVYAGLAADFAVYTALYGGATAGLVAWMVKRFDRLAGRL